MRPETTFVWDSRFAPLVGLRSPALVSSYRTRTRLTSVTFWTTRSSWSRTSTSTGRPRFTLRASSVE